MEVDQVENTVRKLDSHQSGKGEAKATQSVPFVEKYRPHDLSEIISH